MFNILGRYTHSCTFFDLKITSISDIINVCARLEGVMSIAPKCDHDKSALRHAHDAYIMCTSRERVKRLTLTYLSKYMEGDRDQEGVN